MAAPDHVDTEGWARLARDLGIVTLGSGTAPGGAGGCLVDAAAVLEVLGEVLYPGPYLSSMVATQALLAIAPGDPAERLLGSLASGGSRTVCVFPRTAEDHLTVGPGAGAPTLRGEFVGVPDAAGADTFLVAGAGTEWFVVAAAHLTCSPQHSLDQTRRLARLTLNGAPARALALTTAADTLLERLVTVERIAVAVELLGVARHALDAGVAYAKEREQFGRPIGSFQALQHWLTDVALSVECAWSAAYAAAWEYDRDPDSAARPAALAMATAGDASMAAAEQMMQIHGGVGFTWDNPAHLYLKRAKSNRLLWGHPDVHRDRLGQLLDL